MDFIAVNEQNQFKDGELITTFKLDNDTEEYILYSLNDYNNDECKILVSYLKQNAEGFDQIIPIDDIEQKRKVTKAFKEIMNGGN